MSDFDDLPACLEAYRAHAVVVREIRDNGGVLSQELFDKLFNIHIKDLFHAERSDGLIDKLLQDKLAVELAERFPPFVPGPIDPNDDSNPFGS